MGTRRAGEIDCEHEREREHEHEHEHEHGHEHEHEWGKWLLVGFKGAKYDRGAGADM